MRRAHQGISGLSNDEQIRGENIATDLPIISSGQRINLKDDDMNKLWQQGFDVYDDTLQNLENIQDRNPVAVNDPPVLNWKTGSIVCPQRAANLQNLFASFCNYSKAGVMKMSRLDMFLIMLLINFIGENVIKQTSKWYDVPLTTQEYIKWVCCWLYVYVVLGWDW